MEQSAYRGIYMVRRLPGFILLALFVQLFVIKAFGVDEIHTLRGRIIDAVTEEPVSGVVIRMVEARRESLSDKEGGFILGNLDAGHYTLVLSHSQYLKQHIVVQIPVASDLEIEIQPSIRYHETVIVTAAPWIVDRADVAQSANALDTAELQVRSGLSVGEAISSIPGVRNISTGESGGVPMIRGQTNERIRVLTNGFPHDYYQFSRRHMPNIETYDTNLIEVIRGPASVLYGTQAMGGISNLVSAPLPTAPEGEYVFQGEGLLGYAGNNESVIGHVLVEGASGGFGGRASWTRRVADNMSTPGGDLPNTDYDQRSNLIEVGYQSPKGYRLRGQYRYWENDLGFYIPVNPDFRLNLRNDIGEVEAILPTGWGEWRISSNVSRNNRRAFTMGRGQGAKVDLKLLTQSYRTSLQHKPAGPLRGWLQLEYNRQKNESFGPVTLLPFYRNRTWAIAVFEEVRLMRSRKLDKLVLNLGLRYDNRHLEVPANPERGIPENFAKNYSPVTSSVGVVYRFNRALSAGFSFSRGWRNPSEFELFADGPHDGALLYERGNPDLKEETNLNSEFTLRLEGKRVHGFLALFYEKYENYIYEKLTGEMQDGLPVGIFGQSDAVIKGLEGQLSVDATHWFTFSVAGDTLRTKNKTTGRKLPFIPPDRAIFGLHFHGSSSDTWIHPFVEIRNTLIGRGEISGPDEPFPLNTGGYALFDLGSGIQRRFDKHILSFDLWIHNLANRSYKDFLDTYKLYALSPGRNIRATLRFLF